MSEIIRNGQIHSDDWTVLRLAEGEEAAAVELPAGRVMVPLAVWQARRDALLARAEAGTLGVWLAGNDDPAAIAGDLPTLRLVAVDFPKFADGRGYSIAALLRSRHGYGGELRAIGEVLRDQFFYLSRCGFDSLQASTPQPNSKPRWPACTRSPIPTRARSTSPNRCSAATRAPPPSRSKHERLRLAAASGGDQPCDPTGADRRATRHGCRQGHRRTRLPACRSG
jgi:uncharacterized protein (DUF934 family)